jgi:hypothetical protein
MSSNPASVSVAESSAPEYCSPPVHPIMTGLDPISMTKAELDLDFGALASSGDP